MMDAKLQLLKRQAKASGDPQLIWQYARALERLVGSKEEDDQELKVFQVSGFCQKFRVMFHCIAPDETSVRKQFEMALEKQPTWGSVHWDFQFDDYAGPVDGWEQPFHVLRIDGGLPIVELSRYDNVLRIEEVNLNTLREFC
jgi:hypothetical protein